VNTFKPFTGTKTSVVFLQKWNPNEELIPDDYEIFMATSVKSGKDNSGNYIPKTDSKLNIIDEDGVPVAESGKPAAVDHDLDAIATAFVSWGKTQGFSFLKDS
jgi:type I restriction enzyme M protein